MAHDAITPFCAYLGMRNYAPHTIENYGRDLRLFFAPLDKAPRAVSWRDIERFIQQQRQAHLAPATINRRLHALKHFFEYLVMEEHSLASNPVKPVISCAEVARCPSRSRRTTFVPSSPRSRIPWIMPWRCSCCAVACASVKSPTSAWTILTGPSNLYGLTKAKDGKIVWCICPPTRSQPSAPASPPGPRSYPRGWCSGIRSVRIVRCLPKASRKIERYAKAAGIKASCHSLRHTFASNLLEAGAEVISIKELLGHASIKSSERYAKLSNQRVKQVYQQTMRKVIAKTRV